MRLGHDIAERLLEFALAAVRVAGDLPRDVAGRHVASQLVRSATGGGANYEEARAAESRDDFIHKVLIAAKELREAIFWLELVHRAHWTAIDLAPTIDEANQLAAILAASARTARTRLS